MSQLYSWSVQTLFAAVGGESYRQNHKCQRLRLMACSATCIFLQGTRGRDGDLHAHRSNLLLRPSAMGAPFHRAVVVVLLGFA
eukprot:5715475-Pyramimonas_sp.AAC.1